MHAYACNTNTARRHARTHQQNARSKQRQAQAGKHAGSQAGNTAGKQTGAASRKYLCVECVQLDFGLRAQHLLLGLFVLRLQLLARTLQLNRLFFLDEQRQDPEPEDGVEATCLH